MVVCAAQAAAVLVGLAITAVWPGGWWIDPVIGLAVAATAVWEGKDGKSLNQAKFARPRYFRQPAGRSNPNALHKNGYRSGVQHVRRGWSA